MSQGDFKCQYVLQASYNRPWRKHGRTCHRSAAAQMIADKRGLCWQHLRIIEKQQDLRNYKL